MLHSHHRRVVWLDRKNTEKTSLLQSIEATTPTNTSSPPLPTMTLPRSSINAIRSNLDRALSAKDPSTIATAVDVPLLKTNICGGLTTSDNSSGFMHQEQLKVDGVDWSNVLNSLLDVHFAIASVSIF
jgi:hypothetical protein